MWRDLANRACSPCKPRDLANRATSQSMQAINDLLKLNRRAAAKSLPIKPNKEQR
jgi:hypothetical protein